MLSPEYLAYLDSPANPLAKLYDQLEEYVMKDIIRRIATSEGRVITASAEWQMIRLIALGELPENILAEIQRTLNLSESEFEELLNDAIQRSDRFSEEVTAKTGITPPPLKKNAVLMEYIDAVRKQTGDTFRNITASLGFAVKKNGKLEFKPLAKFYQETLDFALTQVTSGTVDYVSAIKQAADTMTASGLRWVDYASGHRDRVGVAARRAVLAGVTQVSSKITEARMEDFDSDLVEVSAHAGARNTGTGPANHKEWQGKVYRWRRAGRPQTSKGDYPDFIASTGYGTGEGLNGWNCKHAFDVFIEDVSERIWSDEELKNIDPPPFKYRGKVYDYYAATQQQRKLERNIRYSKEQLLVLQTAVNSAQDKNTREKVQQMYTNRAIKLRRQRGDYKDFCTAGNLKEQQERTSLPEFGRREAAKASAAARRTTKT